MNNVPGRAPFLREDSIPQAQRKKNPYAQPEGHEVGRLARIAAKWAVVLLIVRQAITIITTMIVSRYVSPSDTGTVAMVTTFVSFIVLFDTGLTWATVQTKELSKEQLDSLFWIGILLGSILWLISLAAGPVLAQFYHNENLKSVCAVMGLSPFLNSISTQPAAFLKRQLRQKASNTIDTAAIFFSSLLGIWMALSHAGYWAIVAQLVSMQGVRVILLLLFSGFRPGRPSCVKKTLPLLKFGGYLAVSNYICYFQLYLGSILIGWAFGSAALGNYMKAFGLKTMPTMYATMVVTDVMVASLAALQTDRERMGAAYRKALMLTAFVGCPAGALLLPMAPEAVRFLYGPQWDLAVPLLKWLALPAILLPISTTTIWLFLAAGKGREQLRMNIWLSVVTVIVFLTALKFSNMPQDFVAVEALLFALPFPIINMISSHRAVGIKLRDTFNVIVPILGCSLFMATFVSFLGVVLPKTGMTWGLMLVLKFVVGIIIYCVLALKYVNPFPVPAVNRWLSRT